ncbi:nucleosome assembly protein 1;2-like [Rutidosis leptorrhynchoides]|uniref:nucleosome assembly protein 1;2-like n=1 Tax=Rutidosis leptorrhynchoides TaxID=125765 RepID=UPI003A999862
MDAKIFQQNAEWELNYQKQYEALYSERYDIVNGVVEVAGVNNKAANEHDKEEKGVPNFWLTAMKNNEELVHQIHERDEDVLKYLKDIKWFKTNEPGGFKLEFMFDANPYFKNSILSIVYYDTFCENVDLDLIPNKATGTVIEWLPGKCLTQGSKRRQKGFSIFLTLHNALKMMMVLRMN